MSHHTEFRGWTVHEQGDGWSEARLRHAEASLATAVEKADRIIAKAREQAARDAVREDDEMLDPLNRNDSPEPDEDDGPPTFEADPPSRPADRSAERSYLRDAW